MNAVMLDLETMGAGPDAAVIAIGAVAFDLDELTLPGHEFYQTIDLGSAVSNGGVMTAATVLWWMKQSDEARAEFAKPGCLIDAVLDKFACWLGLFPPGVKVWGNGANFDNVILRSAYERFGCQAPWNFRDDRCFRTAKALLPEVAPPTTGAKHNALEDARWQAEYLIRAVGASRR